jgi:hypothetical protein
MLGLRVELQLTKRNGISGKKDRSLSLFICLGCALGDAGLAEVLRPSSLF